MPGCNTSLCGVKATENAPRSEDPISASREEAHASAVVEFSSDQTCEASGLTQYPLTLGCIYVG